MSQIRLNATIEITFANFYYAIPMLHFGRKDYYEKYYNRCHSNGM